MIKSFSDDQTYLLESILQLCGLTCFDVDLTYGNGGFWKKLPQPLIKMDIDPQKPDVIKACSTATGLDTNSVNSVMFDPPFLTYIRAGRAHGSIMAKRFGGYWTYKELTNHYQASIKEAARILKPKGILVVKCQDIIHNHKMHSTHINVVNWSQDSFTLKDLFILTANKRMGIPPTVGHTPKQQRHARIHHSYFLVMNRKTQ